MKNVVIVSGVRTPVGSFGGSLKSVPVVDLGTIVMKDVLKRVGLKPAVDASQNE
ncbi:MAG: acetyl-CoA C-acyltransferase, partial [Desulfobacteraceae bacterium]|nr:acetyl-CoA C-acyltransferase [Desulfobacteraceae bacterium]